MLETTFGGVAYKITIPKGEVKNRSGRGIRYSTASGSDRRFFGCSVCQQTWAGRYRSRFCNWRRVFESSRDFGRRVQKLSTCLADRRENCAMVLVKLGCGVKAHNEDS